MCFLTVFCPSLLLLSAEFLILLGLPCKWYFIFLLLFSRLPHQHFTVLCLFMGFLAFILFEACRASWILRLLFFNKFEITAITSFYWNRVDLKYCVTFRWKAKIFSYIYSCCCWGRKELDMTERLTHTHVCVCVCICMCVHVCVFVCVCMCVCMYV